MICEDSFWLLNSPEKCLAGCRRPVCKEQCSFQSLFWETLLKRKILSRWKIHQIKSSAVARSGGFEAQNSSQSSWNSDTGRLFFLRLCAPHSFLLRRSTPHAAPAPIGETRSAGWALPWGGDKVNILSALGQQEVEGDSVGEFAWTCACWPPREDSIALIWDSDTHLDWADGLGKFSLAATSNGLQFWGIHLQPPLSWHFVFVSKQTIIPGRRSASERDFLQRRFFFPFHSVLWWTPVLIAQFTRSYLQVVLSLWF